ncbi:hypothetical protein DSM112329_03743 [Paraconexibacter sp. AEG42_29]|uniref:Uncharacterized protein n=1 Tax=Paraconexibacter sp. AEG42_29 TaxID=2997339 RepID=A0AAU7AYR8_9ACTN
MSTPARQAARDAPGGPLFWISNAIGMGILVFGVVGLLRHQDATVPLNVLKFLAGSLIAHDALFAPLVGLGSLVIVRLVPRRVRPALQGTLIISAAVVLISIPVLTGRGRNPNNPSILPGDYGTGLLQVLAVVWAVGVIAAIRALLRPPVADDPPRAGTLPPQNGW